MVFVADDAFPLSVWHEILKRRSERIFDDRLSRFRRRISENAFGIWINRFRLFASKATLKPGKVEIVVLASLVLHTMLRTLSRASHTLVEFGDDKAHGARNWSHATLPTFNPSPQAEIN